MTQKQVDKINENGHSPAEEPDPEVLPQAKRRTFTAAYKLWVLEEADKGWVLANRTKLRIGATDPVSLLAQMGI